MYPIPANATRIRYLESTGTQYIDTGIYYATPIEFQADVSVTQIDGANCVFGCSTVTNRFSLGFSTAGKIDLGMGAGVAAPSLAQSIVLGQRYLFRYRLASRRTIWQDGTSLWTGDLQSAPSNVSIWAFGSRRGPSDSEAYQRSGDGWKGRIYALKIMQGSGYPLVRSFVPVRVGSVGYLFDRVSGQLFGNAGTGDFVLGPDTFAQGVLPTRMCVMGVRKRPTTLDYIQDGLIGMWDGIDNAGNGVHNASATSWVDLSGNGQNATAPSGLVLPTWADNCAQFPNDSSNKAGLKFTPSSALTGASAMTVEICYKVEDATSRSGSDFLIHFAPSGQYWYNGRLAVRFNLTGSLSNSSAWSAPNTNQCRLFYTEDSDAKLTGTLALPFSAFQTQSTPYYNGVSFTPAQNADCMTCESMSSCTGVTIGYASGGGTYPNGYHIGKIYAVRIYNRALLASEIAHNYAIDKKRFNLP